MTTEQIESKPLSQQLITLNEKRDAILARVRDMTVTTEDEYHESASYEAELKGIIKRYEESRDSEVRPWNDEVKQINKRYKDNEKPAADLLVIVVDRNKEYQREKLRKQREEQEAAAEKARLEFEAAQEKERQAREESARLLKVAEEAEAKGDTDTALQAGFDAQQLSQKADIVAPLVPEPVAPIISSFTKTVKTDAGTTTTKLYWDMMYQSAADAKPETTRIDKRFMDINEKRIKAFVKQGIFTKDVQLKPGYWTIKECQGIIVFENVSNTSRSAGN